MPRPGVRCPSCGDPKPITELYCDRCVQHFLRVQLLARRLRPQGGIPRLAQEYDGRGRQRTRPDPEY